MERKSRRAGWLAGGVGWFVGWSAAIPLLAQQMTIGTPFRSIQEGFFEHIGVQWALQGRNWSIQFGGADLAQPSIGGFQPGAGIQGGFQFGGPGWTGQLQFSAGQGNTRTVTSATPSVTIMNGATGYVADTSLSPFVIGLIPVVGAGGLSPWVGTLPGIGIAGPPMPGWVPVPGTSKVERFLAEGDSRSPNRSSPPGGSGAGLGSINPFAGGGGGLIGAAAPQPAVSTHQVTPAKDVQRETFRTSTDPSLDRLSRAQQSTAGQPVLSVAEAKAIREAEIQQANQQAQEFFQRAQQAEQAGKIGLAATYYRMAAQRASGQLKQQILARLATLQSQSPAR
ncbi:MAG: hypothetical protein NZ602_01515 [Thermoguttaceae bacterium]|nr:hypothetical protein [Thermoguttaceae bacterium]MDW8037466.1 hypothetical protein [Thermoguttaceae bacterium]